MKKISFLTKLKNNKKVQIIEPSQEICYVYIEKSEKSLKSAKITFKIECYENSVALSYYSKYYMILALFFRIGLKCENHTATIILLEKIFDIDNTTIKNAKKERIDKQYYVDFSVTKKEVNQMIKLADQFNSEIFSFVDSLNQTKIKKYRMKSRKIF